jgi:hypothetical protein
LVGWLGERCEEGEDYGYESGEDWLSCEAIGSAELDGVRWKLGSAVMLFNQLKLIE